MLTSRLTLTGKYASSAYVAALRKDSKTLQKVESDMKAIQSSLGSNSKLQALITNPTLSVQERMKALDEAMSSQKPDAITR